MRHTTEVWYKAQQGKGVDASPTMFHHEVELLSLSTYQKIKLEQAPKRFYDIGLNAGHPKSGLVERKTPVKSQKTGGIKYLALWTHIGMGQYRVVYVASP